MPNYKRFHVNCYLKATCYILFFVVTTHTVAFPLPILLAFFVFLGGGIKKILDNEIYLNQSRKNTNFCYYMECSCKVYVVGVHSFLITTHTVAFPLLFLLSWE